MTITKSIGTSFACRLINWLNSPASDRFSRSAGIFAGVAPVLAGVLPVTIVILTHAHH